jgi:multidrug resistance efflux pump
MDKGHLVDALRAEVARLQEAANDAMALVLSHEGHIEKLDAEVAALKAKLDKANERAEQAGAEWTRAKFAWRRRGDLVRSAFFAEDFDILDQYFGGGEGTVNWDTNRVCPKCLHQYNDRVIHDCNDKETK